MKKRKIKKPVRKTAKRKTARRKAVKKAIKKKMVKRSIKRSAKAKTKRTPRKKTTRTKKKTSARAQSRSRAQKPIGTVTHYYRKIKVAIVRFKEPVSVGAGIRFEGATTDFKDRIVSMEYNHVSLKRAPRGKQIGMKVKRRVREGDAIFKDE